MIVSEELSSVETCENAAFKHEYRIVSEELSSVETLNFLSSADYHRKFQKNLVVWKLYLLFLFSYS